jgi:hypothetical protein
MALEPCSSTSSNETGRRLTGGPFAQLEASRTRWFEGCVVSA